MTMLGLVIGPHSFWGWVLEVGIGGSALLVICWLVSLALEFHAAGPIVAEGRAYNQARQHIDQLYRQAEQEVWRQGW
jgi:hypothetical protein